MIITFANGKGGSGKSTAVMLTALALEQAGYSVAVLDWDPQQTASEWVREAGAGRIAVVVSEHTDHDVTLIDTAPRLDSHRVRDAVRIADRVIIPASPSPADLVTTRRTVDELITGTRSHVRLLFTQVQPGTILARDLDQIAKQIGIKPLSAVLHRRQAYQHAILTGWRALSPEAREEAAAVALAIITKR